MLAAPPPTEGVVALYTKVRTTENLEIYENSKYAELGPFALRER